MPMARVIAYELEIVGSHGMAAHDYPAMLALVAAGRLRPDLLVTRRLTLEESAVALPAMGEPGTRPASAWLCRAAPTRPGESGPLCLTGVRTAAEGK